tara:strand:- start:45 stop:677 length:633 start_codon:yes stop_codon:yes gene_type:complete
MPFDIDLTNIEHTPIKLPRLEDVTTEYLDNIAKRLQRDTFSEQAKQTFDVAWQQHYAQLETAAIMIHDDGNDITLCCKLIDSRIRNLEYLMDDLKNYGNRLKNVDEDHVVNDPEITVQQQDDIDDKLTKLRSQYAHIRNMHFVLKTMVRPEIERRTGYTMDAYKSKAQLDTERKTKKWSHFRKRVTMDVYMSWTPKQRQAYTEKYGRRVQ